MAEVTIGTRILRPKNPSRYPVITKFTRNLQNPLSGSSAKNEKKFPSTTMIVSFRLDGTALGVVSTASFTGWAADQLAICRTARQAAFFGGELQGFLAAELGLVHQFVDAGG